MMRYRISVISGAIFLTNMTVTANVTGYNKFGYNKFAERLTWALSAKNDKRPELKYTKP